MKPPSVLETHMLNYYNKLKFLPWKKAYSELKNLQ